VARRQFRWLDNPVGPNARLGLYPLNCHFACASDRAGAHPNHTKSRASIPKLDLDQITRPERLLESHQQCASQADAFRHGSLLETLPVGANATDLDSHVDWNTSFASTVGGCHYVSFGYGGRYIIFISPSGQML